MARRDGRSARNLSPTGHKTAGTGHKPSFPYAWGMLPETFHPAVAGWFRSAFAAPTSVQLKAWAAIRSGTNTLISAPTGSGKTLAAFLGVIDELAKQAAAGALRDETQVLYVSPLKALSNDIEKNLRAPLDGIGREFAAQMLGDAPIRAAVRTGDTPQSERARMRRTPPHILVTTPESLYILLTAESGREMLRTVRTVIVDEIHAVAGNKRGAHLALSLERLDALCALSPTRVGISATTKPIDALDRVPHGHGEHGVHRDRRGPRAQARSRARAAAVPARGDHGERGVGRGVRPARGADPSAPDDARVREYPPARGARRAPSRGAARRRRGHLAPRQPRQGASVAGRGAAQGGRAQGSRRNVVPRARHRHRRCGPRVPARLAARDRGAAAARGPLGPRSRPAAEGPALSTVARRPRGVHRAAR